MRTSTSRLAVVVASAVVASAVVAAVVIATTAVVRRATVVVPDTRPAFTVDPARPFTIELGRGSGRDGLDVVSVDQTGRADLSRTAAGRNAEQTSVQLSPAELARVVALVNGHGLTAMGRSYTDPDVADGMQWVLSVRQPPAEKAVYFNNAFPSPATAFADGLDAVLREAGLSRATWVAAPPQLAADRQAALWDRVK